MRIIAKSELREDIHFPITKAIYKVAPKRNWFQKIIKFFTYRRWFELCKDYIIWVPNLNCYVFVPNGFCYDLASVPKLLNGIFNTNGMLLLGALPHDFGYRYRCLMIVNKKTGLLYKRVFTKAEFDKIFESLCGWESGFYFASAIARYVLTIVGFLSWQENKKEHHVLEKDFPSLFAKL